MGILIFLHRRPAAQPRSRARPIAIARKLGSLGMTSLSICSGGLLFFQLHVAITESLKGTLKLSDFLVFHATKYLDQQTPSVCIDTADDVFPHAGESKNHTPPVGIRMASFEKTHVLQLFKYPGQGGGGYVEHLRNVSWLVHAVKYHVQDAELWCRKALYILVHPRLGEDVHHDLGSGEYLVFEFKQGLSGHF